MKNILGPSDFTMLTSVKVIISKLAIFLALFNVTTSLIVPEEVPTILGLIYSNIPPIKKGTDSRVGVGFRLGEHADFQMLFELGPQKETDAIGNVDNVRRRQTMMSAAMKGELGPWAQAIAKYQIEQNIQKNMENFQKLDQKFKTSNIIEEKKNKNNSGAWLEKWSKEMEQSTPIQVPSERVSTNKIVLNVVNSPTLPNDS